MTTKVIMYGVGQMNMLATRLLKERGIDKHCFSLREGNIIYGFLNKSYYKGRELAQVKASDGTLLWLESAAIKDVTIDHIKKPEPWHTVLRNQDGKVIN